MLLFLLASAQAAYPVNKCCPAGQALGAGTKTCSALGPTSPTHVPEVLAPGVQWQYNGSPCPDDQSELLSHDEFSVIGGSLILDFGEENITYPHDSFCVDNMHSYNGSIVAVAIACPCKIVTCVRKCCQLQYILDFHGLSNSSCIDAPIDEEWIPKFANSGIAVYTVNGYPKCQESGFYLLNTDPHETQAYQFQDDGSLKLSNSESVIDIDNYCGEITRINGYYTDNFVLCLSSSHKGGYVERTIYTVLLVIGSVFLLLTLFVQYSMSELRRTVHSKNLTSHTFCLLVGYTILTVQSLGFSPSSLVLCAILGYTTQFAFLATFFWLNVMCVDITWTFSGFRIPEGNSLNESEGKKYTYYSIYVWISTSIIVLLTLIVDLLISGTSVAPDFGTQKCWFKGKLATLLFFYLPISVLLLTNVVLFLYTSFKIIKVRRDTVTLLRQDGMRPSCSNFQRFNEFKFTLYLKLSLLMGISWIFEVIAWAVDDEKHYFYLYVFSDAINALRGVFLFFFFCRKKKLIVLIRSKVSSIAGFGAELRRRRTKNSSSKSFPGDSSTLYTSHQTQQTHTG